MVSKSRYFTGGEQEEGSSGYIIKLLKKEEFQEALKEKAIESVAAYIVANFFEVRVTLSLVHSSPTKMLPVFESRR
jgi:hypothetical protein